MISITICSNVFLATVWKNTTAPAHTLSIFGHQMPSICRRIPDADHQEAAAQSIVHELCGFWPAIPTSIFRITAFHLERIGLTPMGSRPIMDQVAILGRRRTDAASTDFQRHRHDPAQSGFARLIVSAGIRPMSTRWRCRRCHCLFQFSTCSRKLSCQSIAFGGRVSRRAFNIASYALLDDDGAQ